MWYKLVTKLSIIMKILSKSFRVLFHQYVNIFQRKLGFHRTRNASFDTIVF